MSLWNIEFTAKGAECFGNLSAMEKKRVAKKLDWLVVSFDHVAPLALTGEWQGFFKLRVGDTRVIYKADYKKLLLIINVIGPRDKVYKM